MGTCCYLGLILFPPFLTNMDQICSNALKSPSCKWKEAQHCSLVQVDHGRWQALKWLRQFRANLTLDEQPILHP